MKKKPIKSFKHSDPNSLKVGDEVWLGDMEKTDFFKDKCSTCYVELNGVEKVQGLMITEDQPCWGHETYELIHQIGAKKALRIEQWRDKDSNGAWRAGIEWFSADNYEFLCEQPTLLEALRMVRDYMDKAGDFIN